MKSRAKGIRDPLDNYSRIGRQYGIVNDEKPIHLYYARPHLISLFPSSANTDLKIERVLDLGCGTGYFGQMAKKSYQCRIDYLDGTADLLEMAQEKGDKNDNYICHDMNKKMTFYENGIFDFIVSGLAIHYVKDWNMLFSEISRILKKGGVFVFSTHNPYLEYTYLKLKSYFEMALVEETWADLGTISFYHHTMEDLMRAILENGLVLEKYVEPLPLPEMKKFDSNFYNHLVTRPQFLFFKIKKI